MYTASVINKSQFDKKIESGSYKILNVLETTARHNVYRIEYRSPSGKSATISITVYN